MIVRFAWLGNALVARPLARRLDASIAGELKRILVEKLCEEDGRIVLNCSQLEFVDSSGLGALISVLEQPPEPMRFTLCEVSPSVMQLLKLARIDRILKIWTTEAEAVAALNADHLAA